MANMLNIAFMCTDRNEVTDHSVYPSENNSTDTQIG